MFLIAATIFLGALLLFQVQPLIGKAILPWFGGTPAVWTTCLLFFQVLLLAGYGYAHWIDSKLSPRRQGWIHAGLLIASVAVLFWQVLAWDTPLLPGTSFRPGGTDQPVGSILVLLLCSIGLPFLVLATTSPLLQAWFRRALPGRSPYPLYGLSNAGSLLALLSYPFLIEPWLSLSVQAWVWVGAYSAYALLAIVSALASTRSSEPVLIDQAETGEVPTRPSLAERGLWLGLAACGSSLLLAATNQICQEVAVIPFLWVVPLVLYLLSFILTFSSDRWYKRAVFGPALMVALAATCLVIYQQHRGGAVTQLVIYSLGLFVCCMICHGELARRRPHPRHLTGFYLMLSLGGALGGTFVALVAPLMFDGYWELHLSLFACAALFWTILARDRGSWMNSSKVTVKKGLTGAGLVLLGLSLVFQTLVFQHNTRFSSRSFYGILRVRERAADDPALHRLQLVNGLILHGEQYVENPHHTIATSYFGNNSGLGIAIHDHPARTKGKSPLRVGVIGLGIGTIAAHGRPGDVFRFYEINPQVVELARGEHGLFDYLAQSKARIEIVPGDGRLSLDRERDTGELNGYHVLVVDAFSSDAIPVHLLTVEAFELYLQHLDPAGILAIHISNRHLDLSGLVLRLANHHGMPAVPVHRVAESDYDETSDWVLVTRNLEFLALPAIAGEVVQPDPDRSDFAVSLWTDDFNNLLEVLK